MSETIKAGIPVYVSSHNYGDSCKGNGAFINWQVGQRVRVLPSDHPQSRPTTGTVVSETMAHETAPEIEGARGRGPWVREVVCDDDGRKWAISEARLDFLRPPADV